jgi:hypothetical protein
MANSAPTLNGLTTAVTFDENTVNATPQLIDADVTFTDPDNNFTGAALTVTGLLAEDTVAIRNVGTAAGEIGVSGSSITFGGVTIGSFTGGAGGILTVTFNAAATAAAVEALIENLTYANSSGTPTGSRDLEIKIADAAGLAAIAPLAFTARTGTANPFDGAAFDVGIASTPSFADLDGDGDLDAIVGDNDGILNYYQNTGSATAPVFASAVANPFGLADVGLYSTPSFADLDGDGDLDAAVGEVDGNLHYFQNTGSAGAPSFAAAVTNPFGLADVGLANAPSFADLDGDGDLDASVGNSVGNLIYFQNTGSAAAPAFAAAVTNPFGLADVGSFNTPSFADLDGDGDLDAIVGAAGGNLKYFENTGSATAPAFIARAGLANSLDGVDVGSASAPSFADLDGDGDLDVIVGNDDGTLNYFENTTPHPPAPDFVAQTGAANPFDTFDVGMDSAPSLADLDGDGDLDAIVGEFGGGLKYFENIGSAIAPDFIERTGIANPIAAVTVDFWSVPAFADLDGDGDLDAIVGNNDGELRYAENTGTAAAPTFAAAGVGPFSGIDVGFRAAPSFGDLDGDGDLDIVVGSLSGPLRYFENTGTVTGAAFTERTGTDNPFDGINPGSFSKPSLADVDGDGDLDAVVGGSYLENTGSATDAAFIARTGAANPFDAIDVMSGGASSFADLDGDGDVDAIVGNSDGTLSYLQNTGASFVLTVNVTAQNDAPVSHDDGVYGVTRSRSLTVSSYTGVLANDFDGDHDTLTAIKLTDPSHGTVTLNADGSFIYTPAAGYTGTDSFTYKVNDGTIDSATATVKFNVATGSPFPTIDLTTLTAAQGFIIQGAAGDNAGTSVASAGDVNGDGYVDMIVGTSGFIDDGKAYVVFGKASGFGTDVSGRQVIDVTSLAAADGFIIEGDTNDNAGASVASAGDVNGDGYADLIVGSPAFSGGRPFVGEAYVVFGKASGFGTSVGGRQVIDVASLSAADGFIIRDASGLDRGGESVASAGDVNGDGYADLIVGSPGDDAAGNNVGAAYVVFGRASGFGTDVGGRQVIDLTTLSATDGFIIQGDADGDITGHSVASAGDVNRDGYADLIVGVPNGDDGGNSAGEAYVVFGKASGLGTSLGGRQVIDLTALSAADGFIIQGDTGGDHTGYSVATAGDINGDGYADLIVGAPNGDDAGGDAGEAYVVFGKASGFGTPVGGRQVIDLTALSAADGFIIQGAAAGDIAGLSVASAGDVNGDGYADLIVGAPLNNSGGVFAGEVYVVFGKASGFGTPVGGRQVIDVAALSPRDGFKIQGDADIDAAGWSVASAGDINRDGFADLIVGADQGDDGGNIAGEAYVVFGHAFNIAPADIALAPARVAENGPSGTVVGALTATDADDSSGFTYTLVDDAGGRFAISGSNLVVASGVLIDFEQHTSHAVTVQVTDPGGATFEETLIVTVTNVPGLPSDDAFNAPGRLSQFEGGSGTDTITFDFKLTEATVTHVGAAVIIEGPGGSSTALAGFERFAFTDGTVNNADGSPLIDDLFYYSQNHDVWNAQVDADFHYNAAGWKEGRDPSAFFDLSIYLSANPDVKAAGANPLTHYDTTGWIEGRAPSLTFDGRAYLDANPDVKAAGIDPLWHFLASGAGEGRHPIAPTKLATANGFDFVYYLARNPDVAVSGVDPYWHFQNIGWTEGRNPNAWFDTAGYLAHYTDVAAAHLNPLDHYNASGWHEGRDPSLAFDTAAYLSDNPDVAAANTNPLVHFLQSGHYEGRSAIADGVWGP